MALMSVGTRRPVGAAVLASVLSAVLMNAACQPEHGDIARPTRHPISANGAPLHVPPDVQPFNDQRWDVVAGNGWSHLRRASSKDDRVVRDDQAPLSPPLVLQIIFTPDMLRDHEPSVHWVGLPRVRE